MTKWRRAGAALLAATCCFSLLTGCWDRVEIDERGFVAGVAIDMDSKNGEEENKRLSKQKYKGTYQIVVPAGLHGAGTGKEPGGGGGSGSAFFNITSSESSIMALSAKLATKMSRTPYFEHLQIIAISNDVLKNKGTDVADILDFFLRNNEMRRDIKVLVTDGKARQMMNVKPQSEKYPVSYIESTIKNNTKSNYMLPPSRVGDIHEQILKKTSFTIQKISIYEEGISLVGAALFDGGHQFIGFLSGEDTQGLNFLRQQIKGGVVETQLEEQVIDFEVESAKRQIHAYPDGDSFRFVIDVKTEGTVGKSVRNLDISKLTAIHTMEDLFADKIKAVCLQTIETLQKKYKKDAIGLGDYLKQNHYRKWQKIKANWEEGDNLFSEAKIEMNVTVKIRRLGNINQSERK